MEKLYAQALFTLAQKSATNGTSADELVKHLVAHLQSTGKQKLLPRILREMKRLDARHQSFSESLEVASEQEVASAERAAKELGITASATINSSLVSGWRARAGSRVIDRSGKRTLIDLYRFIANA